MKRLFLVVVAAASVFLSCDSFFGMTDDVVLPDDIVNDVLRSGDFAYESYLPVGISLTVTDGTASRAVSGESIVVVQLTGSDGQNYFSGAAELGTQLNGEALVPATLDHAVLTVASSDYETREVQISDPAQYESIDREMAVKPDPGSKFDRDDDGIDDVYDAFPDDPDLAFSRAIPASGVLTIAFEDQFPLADETDFDYNDFVANYRIVEYRSAKNRLVKLTGSATAVARGAGFDHSFGVVIGLEGTPIDASISRYDGSGESLGTTTPDLGEPMNLVLFDSTKQAFDREGATVTMDNIRPDLPPSLGHRVTFAVSYSTVSKYATNDLWTPYNPYLKVLDNDGITYQPDIHLIGRPANPDTQIPPELQTFRDPDSGAPWALLVPNDWLWPTERTFIEDAYPDFTPWRTSLGATNSDWYFYPIPELVVPR